VELGLHALRPDCGFDELNGLKGNADPQKTSFVNGIP
jgi:hypothetical protein